VCENPSIHPAVAPHEQNAAAVITLVAYSSLAAITMSQRFREAFTRMAKEVNQASSGGGGAGGSGGGGRAAAAAARSATALAVAGGLAYGTYNSVYTVPGGHRAVVFNRIVGMKNTIYGEGLNFNIPWFERPIVYDIRTRPVNLQTLTGSKDLQMVTIAVRVLHKPDPSKLVWIYRFLGTNYDERILPSIMNESAKAIVARYNANELLTKRDHVSKEISMDLRRRAGYFSILLEDVAITHLSFSPEYARAVEAKQVGKFRRCVVFCGLIRCVLTLCCFSQPQPNRMPSEPSTLSWEHSKRRKLLSPKPGEKQNLPNSLALLSRRIPVL
jgi:prohibitin 2